MSDAVPEGWELLPIGDLTAFSQGIQVDVEQHHEKEDDSKVRFVRISDYTKSDEPPRYIDSSLALKGLVEKNDVVMIRYGEAGRVCRGIVGAIANNLFTIKPNSILEKEYLFQYLTSKEVSQRISELAASSTMPAISFSSLKNINLTVPPLPEQKKIASILTSVDEVFENTQKQIDKLQDLKKATMNELLTKGIGHTEFKDSELGRIPKSWEVKSLGKLCTKVGSGVTPKGGASVYQDQGVIFIRSQNVHFDGLKLEDVAYISEKIHEGMKGSIVNSSDVLLNISGASIGRCTLVPDIFAKANVNQHVCIIRPTDLLNNKFLSFWLSSNYGQEQIKKFQAGGNREGLNFEQIRSFKIPVPLLKQEQEKIGEIIDSIQISITKVENKLQQTNALKQSLMQDLLTGKVRVSVN